MCHSRLLLHTHSGRCDWEQPSMYKVPTGRGITSRGDMSVLKKYIQHPRTQHWDKWGNVTTALQEQGPCINCSLLVESVRLLPLLERQVRTEKCPWGLAVIYSYNVVLGKQPRFPDSPSPSLLLSNHYLKHASKYRNKIQ